MEKLFATANVVEMINHPFHGNLITTFFILYITFMREIINISFYFNFLNRYKLNTIVEDETATANFTIFGKLAQDLIQIPASQLATATNADRYTLPPIISTILGSTHIFQIILSTPTFNTESMSFKVVRILSPPERETATTSEQFASSSSYTISSHNHTQQAKRNREDQLELYLEHTPSKQEMRYCYLL